jgi:hypothetical protein
MTPEQQREHDENRRVNRANDLVKRGHLGRAVRALTQRPIPQLNADSIEQIKSLHPSVPDHAPQLPPPPADAPIVSVNEEDTLKLIKKCANGSAAGLFGLTVEIIQVLAKDPTCLKGITALTNDIMAGSITGMARQLLLACILIAPAKIKMIEGKEVENGVRPIAIQNPFVKVAGRGVANATGEDLGQHLAPFQFAVNVAGGPEVAIHLLQASCEIHSDGIHWS